MSINYERRGSGEPLVLIHGIGHRWQAWLPVLPRLARHHDVIAIDVPGFGESPPPAEGMPRAVPELVAALRREFAELGLQRPHVAGNSLGGGLALELAATGAVASATALAPIGFYTQAEAWHGMVMLNLMRATTFLPERVVHWGASRPWIHDLALAGLVADPRRIDAQRLVGDGLAMRRGKGFWPMGWGLRRYTFTGRPQVPVTIAWGSQDRILRPWQADRARVALPQARHVELPRCGHVPMSDDPAAVCRVILTTTGAAATVDRPVPGARRASPHARRPARR